MSERLKSFGSILLGLSIMAAILVLFGAMIFGAAWLSDRVLPFLNVVSFFLFPLALLVFVPLGFFRGTRWFAGNCLYLSSYVFGITLWMAGLLTTLTLWGFGAVVVGLFLGGIGVVPIAYLASLFKGEWLTLLNLFMLTALTFGSRWVAVVRLTRVSAVSLKSPHPVT